MDNEIKPLHAAAIIVFFIILISSYVWINGKAVEINGPNAIYKNHKNHLFVRLQTDLLEFNDAGQFIKQIDLKKFGVEHMLGDILFTPNNEIILRRGKDNRTLLQNIRAYLRLADTTSTTPDNDSSGLFKCNLQTYSCHRFTQDIIDFSSAYHLEFDSYDNGIFLSDASRHRILKFDDQGKQLFEYSENLKYPNQIQLVDNQLYVANTNHHNITELNIKQNEIIFNDKFNVVPAIASERREKLPATLQHVNDNWWVINMKNSMSHGGIYLFGADWKLINRLNTKAGADPVDIIQWHDDEVLVTDPSNFTLYRFSANGSALSDFLPLELKTKLTALKTQHENFTLLSYLPITIFILAISAGLYIGIRQELKARAQQKQLADTDSIDTPDSNELKWLSIDTKYIRKIRRLAMLAPILIIFSMAPMAFLYDHTKLFNALIGSMLVLFLFIFLLAATAYFYLKIISNIKIGIQGDHITLKDHNGIEASTHISNVYYDHTTLYFDNIAVVYSNHKRSLFHEEEVKKHLLPMLKSAKKINSMKMFYFLYKIKHPSFYYSLVIFGAVAIMFIISLNQQ